jgi:hypothetical protein
MRSKLLAVSAASLLVAAAACGSDSSGPKIGPPAKVEVTSSPTTSGAVKVTGGTFAVKVSDASGQAVSGASVSFSANGGGGISLSPTTATTDATGTARTTVVLGTTAGTATITASVSGVTTSASVSLTTIPGAVAKLVVSPDNIRLNAIGDTASIVALVQDDYANTVSGSQISYAVTDPTLVSVDGAGLVRALRVGGTTNVIATVAGRADTVIVAVLAPGSSACSGVSSPVNLAVGGMATVSGANICIGGAAAGEYALVAYNASLDGSTVLNASVIANGVTTAPVKSRTPASLAPLAARSPSGSTTSPAPVQDLAFHDRIMSMTRALGRDFSAARASRNARLSATRPAASAAFSPTASRTAIPATVAVNDLVNLNTSGTNACNIPLMRWFRVAAIGSKSIILADTANPKNGFSDTDYQRFAARFDTLVYPLDVGAFGAPSDIDGNNKVAVLFTKEVNALTPANSNSFVGGYFFGRDLFPKSDPNPQLECKTSNEGEMFYMLVPDPTGVVNGNKHTTGFVDSLTTGVLAHEFQHLINTSRRIYISTKATDVEDKWLDEGLSHVAEELLYWRESGMQPRQNLDDAAIRVNSKATYPYWKSDASSNFGRLIEYLENPGASSPLDSDDELSTRGAAWSFLRYSVDRLFPNDNGVWFRFVNSDVSGVLTLKAGLLTEPAPLLADWALANYLDDLGLSADPRFKHASWNFRDIYSKTYVSLGGYPLKTTAVPDNLSLNIQVKGASASYYRLAVPSGKDALLTFASGGGAPNASFTFTLIRTK